jgi:hypothetical protein
MSDLDHRVLLGLVIAFFKPLIFKDLAGWIWKTIKKCSLARIF